MSLLKGNNVKGTHVSGSNQGPWLEPPEHHTAVHVLTTTSSLHTPLVVHCTYRWYWMIQSHALLLLEANLMSYWNPFQGLQDHPIFQEEAM